MKGPVRSSLLLKRPTISSIIGSRNLPTQNPDFFKRSKPKRKKKVRGEILRIFGVSGKQEIDETREPGGILSRELVGEMQERKGAIV